MLSRKVHHRCQLQYKMVKIHGLSQIENFVDGAAVKRVGDLTFNIAKQNLHDMITVDEGLICQTILDLYNKEAIVAEPAAALSIAALEYYKDDI